MSEIPLQELKDEIIADPTGIGFAVHVTAGEHNEIASLLNLKNTGIQVDNFVGSFDVEEAVDPADWPTAGNEQWKRDLWRDVLLAISGTEARINANATNVKAKVLIVFAAGTATRSNLAALQQRDGSRTEKLWGLDLVVRHGQVSEALALP